MNLVLNAAFPLTAKYRTDERLERVPVLDKDGHPKVTQVAGRPLVATEEVAVPVRVVDERLDSEQQAERELEVIRVLATAVQQLDAIDARLATRFHGEVDLITWTEEV